MRLRVPFPKHKIEQFQREAKAAGLYHGKIDGLWGGMSEAAWLEMMKTKIIHGSTFPYDDYEDVDVFLNKEITEEYIPALGRALPKESVGFTRLLIAKTDQEGFYRGTRSYSTNNPGNVGNTDAGRNRRFATLEEGIRAQATHLKRVVDGKSPSYPLGKAITIPPLYSKEVERNRAVYGIPAQLPGYRFTYSGQLDQYIKIYSTGARVLNSYINQIVSYFKSNGITITPTSTLAEIIA